MYNQCTIFHWKQWGSGWGLTACHLYWDGHLLSVRKAGKNFLSVSMCSHQLKQYFLHIKKENSSWRDKLVFVFLFWPMAQRVLVKYGSVYLRLRESLKLSLCKFWNTVLPLEVINTLMAESQNKGTVLCGFRDINTYLSEPFLKFLQNWILNRIAFKDKTNKSLLQKHDYITIQVHIIKLNHWANETVLIVLVMKTVIYLSCDYIRIQYYIKIHFKDLILFSWIS